MTLAGKTVLVTGATGFLGGTLALRLAQQGARVRALARNPQKTKRLQDRDNIEIVSGNLTDPDSLRRAAEGAEYVMHCAVDYGSLAQQRVVNVEGTRNMAAASADAGVTRFVHVSSIAVYGYRAQGHITEAAPYAAKSHDPYCITKIEAERAVIDTGEQRSLPYSIVRPGMIYGPRSGMWTVTTFRMAKLRPTPFIGSGSGNVHPIYVDDVCDLMAAAAPHPAAAGLAFHCTPDPAPTWREFLGAYQRLAGHNHWLGVPYGLVKPLAALVSALAPAGTQFKDLPDFAAMTQARMTYKMDRARDLLGWQPQVSLSEGIEHCAVWLREQGMLK